MTPLDCAASRGWNQCAQCLLDADSAINPTDKFKVQIAPFFFFFYSFLSVYTCIKDFFDCLIDNH